MSQVIATWGALPMLLACVEKAGSEGSSEAPVSDDEPAASATFDSEPPPSVMPPEPIASVTATAEASGSAPNEAGGGGVGATTTAPEAGMGGDGQDAATVDDAAFEPAWLPNVPLDSVAGVLTLFASTLKRGSGGLELYAAIRNDGDALLCGASLMMEFYDRADQLIATASTGVQTDRLYRLPDESATIYCVEPGQVAMAAATSLPEGLVIDDLKYIGHRFPAFQIDDAEPLRSATVSDVEPYRTISGTAYRGLVSNTSDSPISDPDVAVFPVNAAGRPLGVAVATGTLEIAPGGTWSFETSAIPERGVDQVAFVTASSVSP